MTDFLYYCIPTYKSFEECARGVHAVMKGSVAPSKVIIIDNSGDGSGTLALHHLSKSYANVFIWPQTYNLGVARAWNTFHRELGEDYVIIANDDIEVHYDAIQDMYLTAKENEDAAIIFGNGNSGNAYSLFLLRHWAFERIQFEERFYPAYFEDNHDVRLRQLAGMKLLHAEKATYDHVGSSTLKKYTQAEMEQHHRDFRRNAIYYETIWGGLPGSERYITPYNGEII